MPWRSLADTVLLPHFGIVLLVLLGLPAIVVGNLAGWHWVNGFWWRLKHLLAIGVVAVQA